MIKIGKLKTDSSGTLIINTPHLNLLELNLPFYFEASQFVEALKPSSITNSNVHFDSGVPFSVNHIYYPPVIDYKLYELFESPNFIRSNTIIEALTPNTIYYYFELSS